MKPEDKGSEKGREEFGTARAGGDHNSESVSATTLLVELAQCQRGIRTLLHTAVASLLPASKHTLPSVAFTLTGLIHATETAANKVLDEAEGLGSERDRLVKALGRLEPFLSLDPAARRAWTDVMECSQAVSTRVISIMSAMAFQDLTTQHLSAAIKSVEEVRDRIIHTLSVLDLPMEPEEPAAPRQDRVGTLAATGGGSRQALADQLWAEMRER